MVTLNYEGRFVHIDLPYKFYLHKPVKKIANSRVSFYRKAFMCHLGDIKSN